jgi:hypothetical protein
MRGPRRSSPNWVLVFTADSASTEIRFEDASVATIRVDAVLDDIPDPLSVEGQSAE